MTYIILYISNICPSQQISISIFAHQNFPYPYFFNFSPFILMESDWAYLPAPALRLILDKLVELVDHVWFGAVCKNWCSIAKLNHQHHGFGSKVLPMLMIPTKRKSRKERSLYSISAKSVYPFRLPLLYSRRCCGSSYGWIATVDPHNVITLLNPFKNVAPIILPPINKGSTRDATFYERNIHKVILSANPTTCPNDYVVATVHNQCCYLAFIKAGQKFWTYVDDDFKCFSDITFYKGSVYAVGRWEGIVSFELRYSNDPTGKKTITPNILSPDDVGGSYSERAYLVKSVEGELWMVRRFLGYPEDDERYSSGTESFKVYKLELDAESGKLLHKLELQSLGDNVLFVGDNDSTSVSASYFSICLQKDSIYYTDDFYDEPTKPYSFGPFDLGIYNVNDRSFGQHYPYNPSFKRMPPPLWVLPSF